MKTKTINLNQYSSFDSLYPNQNKVCNEIINFFESDLMEQQLIFLDLPTGTGKTIIAETIANYFYKKYNFTTNYLASNIYLQKQIIKDFPNTIKHTLGRNNFQCLINGNECSNGECLIKDEYDCQYKPQINNQNQNQNNIQHLSINKLINEKRIDELTLKYNNSQLIEYFKQPKIYYDIPNPICPYWNEKIKAIQSPIALHNYWYFLFENNYVGSFKKRYLLICDEAHKLENIIIDFISFTITQKNVDDLWLPIELKQQTFTQWIKEFKKIEQYLISEEFDKKLHEYITNQFNDYNNTSQDIIDKEYDRIYKIKHDILTGILNIKSINKDNWIIDYKKNYKMNILQSVIFKPINISKYIYDTLLYFPIKIIFMSGTILSKNKFIDMLGKRIKDIDYDGNTKYIQLNSPFPIKNRPIYYMPTIDVNYKNINSNIAIKTLSPVIKKILNHHKNEKGIIHTHSYKLSNMIKEYIQDNRILTHNSYNRDSVIKHFINAKKTPYVLTSPSIEEGVDFKNDLCRFIIIVKVPFLSLADPRIKKKMKQDKDWYIWKTTQTIIQESGRGVRNMNDYCSVYILDGNIDKIFNYEQYIPKWFKDAIIKDFFFDDK